MATKLPRVTYLTTGLVIRTRDLWAAVQNRLVDTWDALLKECMKHCIAVTGYNKVGMMIFRETVIVYCDPCRQKLSKQINVPRHVFATGDPGEKQEKFYREVCSYLGRSYSTCLQTVYVNVREDMELDELLA